MSRTRVGAGLFGPGPGQAARGVNRINAGAFGPGEDERKAKERFMANRDAPPTSEEMRRLEERRRTDPAMQPMGNPSLGPPPGWGKFFDALQIGEMRANDAGMNFKVKQGTPFGLPPRQSPQMNGLRTASRRRR